MDINEYIEGYRKHQELKQLLPVYLLITFLFGAVIGCITQILWYKYGM